jgi:hypothetical protein
VRFVVYDPSGANLILPTADRPVSGERDPPAALSVPCHSPAKLARSDGCSILAGGKGAADVPVPAQPVTIVTATARANHPDKVILWLMSDSPSGHKRATLFDNARATA